MSTNADGEPMLKHAPLGDASPVEVREAESVNGPLAVLNDYYDVYVTCPDDASTVWTGSSRSTPLRCTTIMFSPTSL